MRIFTAGHENVLNSLFNYPRGVLFYCRYNFAFLILSVCAFLDSFQYPTPFLDYYSQHGQDKYLIEEIFKNKRNGIFLEIGAHDGISFSNTYYLEKYLNWNGICVEPIPELFEQLQINRECVCENICIDVAEGKKTFLRCFGYITEMYSGIEEYYDPRHLLRITNEIESFSGKKTVIEVDCTSINRLLEKYEITQIDLLSLDIEGGEEKILRSIDFNRIKIHVILVENNFHEESIRSFLSSKNYILVKRIGKDDVFVDNTLYALYP